MCIIDSADTDTDDDADDTIYIPHHFTIHFNLNEGVITLINHSKVIKNGTKKSENFNLTENVVF